MRQHFRLDDRLMAGEVVACNIVDELESCFFDTVGNAVQVLYKIRSRHDDLASCKDVTSLLVSEGQLNQAPGGPPFRLLVPAFHHVDKVFGGRRLFGLHNRHLPCSFFAAVLRACTGVMSTGLSTRIGPEIKWNGFLCKLGARCN